MVPVFGGFCRNQVRKASNRFGSEGIFTGWICSFKQKILSLSLEFWIFVLM